MSRKNKSDGAIQRVGANLPVGQSVQTGSGPAIIQVIDIPAGGELGPVLPQGPALRKAPGGINIMGAVMRRWWLVLLVASFVGGAGILAADRLVKPKYESIATVLYQPITNVKAMSVATDSHDIVRTHIVLLTKPEVALRAARHPDLQQALPWLKNVDLENPAVRLDVARKLKGLAEATQVPGTELVEIRAEGQEGFTAAAIANAFADAFVEHCSELVMGRDAIRRRKLQEQVDDKEAMIRSMTAKKNQLMVDNDFELQNHQKTTLIGQINEYNKLKAEADIKRIAAEAELEKFFKTQNDPTKGSSELQLARKRRIEEEKQKDTMLQAAIGEQVVAWGAYQNEIGQGKTDQHRDAVLAKARVQRAELLVKEREQQIEAAIDAKVADEQRLMVATTVEQAQQRLAEQKALIGEYEKRLSVMDKDARRLAVEAQKLEALNESINRLKKQQDEYSGELLALDRETGTRNDAIIMVAERADIPKFPSDDKRTKVQAASVIGGLFFGIFLALLVDRFDKRLRHPRDIEPLLGAPVLGMIPKIQELKKVKGEMARNLIAEEFRLIRTQLLFGTPGKEHKVLAITSPVPGDGKTSLAVNLAISLAKAGRKVLLVDADLRKPDVHRIFGVEDGPGFAELIDGSSEPASCIRKTDIENLELCPAGLPTGRPCELLSRPSVRQVIDGLAAMYDHVVFDTAPLLPVTDTHVLLGQVDGVICSFNASVDSETVRMMEEILRRNHANVLGSVMNQVKYKQSSSYHRGKSAYSSYYSTRVPGDEKRTPARAGLTTGSESVGVLGHDDK